MEGSVLSLFEDAILKDASESLIKWGSIPPFSVLIEKKPDETGYDSTVYNYHPGLDLARQCQLFKNQLITTKQYLKLDLILTCCITQFRLFEEDEIHLSHLDLDIMTEPETCLCIVSDSFILQSIITIPIVNNMLDLSRRNHEQLVAPFLISQTLSPIICNN